MLSLPGERVPRTDIIVRIVIVLVNGAFDVVSHHRCTRSDWYPFVGGIATAILTDCFHSVYEGSKFSVVFSVVHSDVWME